MINQQVVDQLADLVKTIYARSGVSCGLVVRSQASHPHYILDVFRDHLDKDRAVYYADLLVEHRVEHGSADVPVEEINTRHVCHFNIDNNGAFAFETMLGSAECNAHMISALLEFK